MDSDVRRSEETSRSEAARSVTPSAESRADESWEDTRRVETMRDREDIYAQRLTYDPGPSGTAVAGLIVALIALAVALYGAFAPREMVREGSQAVTTAWEQTVDSQPARPKSAARQEPGMSVPEVRSMVANEVQKEMASMKAELAKLRSDIVTGGKTTSEAQK